MVSLRAMTCSKPMLNKHKFRASWIARSPPGCACPQRDTPNRGLYSKTLSALSFSLCTVILMRGGIGRNTVTSILLMLGFRRSQSGVHATSIQPNICFWLCMLMTSSCQGPNNTSTKDGHSYADTAAWKTLPHWVNTLVALTASTRVRWIYPQITSCTVGHLIHLSK